jgi:tryptophan synthase alpha subunit
MYDGLTIKNGRLINNRPNGITGIQEAVQIRKDLKKAKKLEMYSEAVSLGIQKAENVEDIKEMFLK